VVYATGVAELYSLPVLNVIKEEFSLTTPAPACNFLFSSTETETEFPFFVAGTYSNIFQSRIKTLRLRSRWSRNILPEPEPTFLAWLRVQAGKIFVDKMKYPVGLSEPEFLKSRSRTKIDRFRNTVRVIRYL
jgi:hypothetical protein